MRKRLRLLLLYAAKQWNRPDDSFATCDRPPNYVWAARKLPQLARDLVSHLGWIPKNASMNRSFRANLLTTLFCPVLGLPFRDCLPLHVER